MIPHYRYYSVAKARVTFLSEGAKETHRRTLLYKLYTFNAFVAIQATLSDARKNLGYEILSYNGLFLPAQRSEVCWNLCFCYLDN